MSLTLFQKLTPPQKKALQNFAATAGANWRAMLIDCWANDNRVTHPMLFQIKDGFKATSDLWQIKTSELQPISALDGLNDRIDRAQVGVAAAQAELLAAIDAKILYLQEQVK